MKENDDRAKVKMKMYADTKARAKASTIKVGDIVLARQRKYNKLSINTFRSDTFSSGTSEWNDVHCTSQWQVYHT